MVLIAIITGIVIGIIIYAIGEKIKGNKEPKIEEQTIDENQSNNYTLKPINTKKIYHRVNLLTKNEYLFYQRLKTYVYPHGLQILAKIRLADLINVNENLNRSEWASAFGKIKSKHIDFAIAKDMKVLIVIELDDNSHYRTDRMNRDEFVNDVLVNAGYKLARTYGDMLPVQKALYDLGYDIERLEQNKQV